MDQPAGVSPILPQAIRIDYPASRRSYQVRRKNLAERWPIYAARAYS
jgi:hypothetical protein